MQALWRCTVASLSSPNLQVDTGWERTPWHATRRAAWEALRRADA
jgi:hypothetical protein